MSENTGQDTKPVEAGEGTSAEGSQPKSLMDKINEDDDLLSEWTHSSVLIELIFVHIELIFDDIELEFLFLSI